jgi:hypothetical protein
VLGEIAALALLAFGGFVPGLVQPARIWGGEGELELDRLVDRIIGAVEEDGLHVILGLAEAVDATLALLQTIRVPRQIVVDDRIEMVLQIDAFAQAIGGDEDARVTFAQLGDPLASLVVIDLAGDGAYINFLELVESHVWR